MNNRYEKLFLCLMCYGLVVYSCKTACTERVVVEIPIISTARDTINVGDTMAYLVRIPEELTDRHSGQNISLKGNELSIYLSIGDLDDPLATDKGWNDFNLLPLSGEITTVDIAGLPFGLLTFSTINGTDYCEFSFVAKRRGRFYFSLDSYYNLSSRVGGDSFSKNLELIGGNDCMEELNLIYDLDSSSTEGYDVYISARDSLPSGATLEAFQESGTLVFVVE